ncbi:MAG: PaaI family thioesterase [Candidatus Obscuribacterales bacterium]|nr:PaaI family thioesterase [Candidatus Obscuribacterales bacterium]
MQTKSISLQEQYAAQSICYGCGPANKDGLHINSFPEGDSLVCQWEPDLKYQAFPGVLYGGLIGCLLDCHCNWTASWHLMQKTGADKPPCTVTAELTVKFLKPTPSNTKLRLVAKVVQSKERSATVEGQLFSGEDLCATCTAVFVAVKEGHPAYHRW